MAAIPPLRFCLNFLPLLIQKQLLLTSFRTTPYMLHADPLDSLSLWHYLDEVIIGPVDLSWITDRPAFPRTGNMTTKDARANRRDWARYDALVRAHVKIGRILHKLDISDEAVSQHVQSVDTFTGDDSPAKRKRTERFQTQERPGSVSEDRE
jgi:hypothetical protein